MITKVFLSSDNNIPWSEMTDLIHEAFKEHADKDIFKKIFNMSEISLMQTLGNGYIFAKYDNNKIIGLVLFSLRSGNTSAEIPILAISPYYKKQGIGRMLMDMVFMKAKEMDLSYIMFDSAFKAKSSMNFHKKMGYLKYSVDSQPDTSYYSCIFKLPLKKDHIGNYKLYILLHYIFKYCKCHLLKKEDGSNRF